MMCLGCPRLGPSTAGPTRCCVDEKSAPMATTTYVEAVMNAFRPAPTNRHIRRAKIAQNRKRK